MALNFGQVKHLLTIIIIIIIISSSSSSSSSRISFVRKILY
jgi:hypothetical protein